MSISRRRFRERSDRFLSLQSIRRNCSSESKPAVVATAAAATARPLVLTLYLGNAMELRLIKSALVFDVFAKGIQKNGGQKLYRAS
jgi:hypothetical protein